MNSNNDCIHSMYRNRKYVQLQNMKRNTVWHGMIAQTCGQYGEDISKYKLVEVKTKDEYLRGLKYG